MMIKIFFYILELIVVCYLCNYLEVFHADIEDFIELREQSYQESVINIDFNDMIYLPVIKNFHIPIDPVYLMIDEAQDLNLAQHKLIENLIKTFYRVKN